jgi:hypothetical protein
VPRKRKPRRLHREPIVRRVAAILDTGKPTRFRHEAACRAGLRAARCLAGDRWRDADQFALLVVALALHRLGISRPTWAQAHDNDLDGRSTTMQRRRCACCGGELDDDDRRMWCSQECGRVMRNRERYRTLSIDTRAARQAVLAASAAGVSTERECDHCGVNFRISERNPLQRYCSRSCALAALQVRAKQAACAHCGDAFAVTYRGKKFCSLECRDAAKRPAPRVGTCARCGEEFLFRNAREIANGRRFCSTTCRDEARRETRLCAYCSTAFTVIRSKPSRFCSLTCAARGRAVPVCEAA